MSLLHSGSTTASDSKLYVEDVFSTYLYTGNGSTLTITNGIDLAGEGGLVWTKPRTSTTFNDHILVDSARGNFQIQTNTTAANTAIDSFNFASTGYTAPNNTRVNASSVNYASWTFRKQPKFFDVVTWTGDGTGTRTISHTLDSAPGFIMVKCTSNTSAWWAYHRSNGNGFAYQFESQQPGFSSGSLNWNATSTTFSVNDYLGLNTSGRTYVAYVFAHNAGGFGLEGTDNVISCGSYTGTGSAQSISLGYEPQWVFVKSSSGYGNWMLFDNMRGIPQGAGDMVLFSNQTNPESSGGSLIDLTSTGFSLTSDYTTNTPSETYIYIAIRRGPMKVPTSGTSVFVPATGAVAYGGVNITTNFPADVVISRDNKNGAGSNTYTTSRLVGSTAANVGYLVTNATDTETTSAFGYFHDYGYNNSLYDRLFANNLWGSGNYADWIFRRAPSFFDEVCYTGTGSARTVTHNLGVAPELIIVKQRNNTYAWETYSATFGIAAYLRLNTTDAVSTGWSGFWGSSNPTSTTFSLGSYANNNNSGSTFVAYLFATCAGVSKVGSYTGNGSSQTINCGFTTGARFILIKRTNSTGDWYIWDSARGIVAGNDPHLSLNSTAAEVTTDDSIDPNSSGFIVNQNSATNINVSGGTYIFLSIA